MVWRKPSSKKQLHIIKKSIHSVGTVSSFVGNTEGT